MNQLFKKGTALTLTLVLLLSLLPLSALAADGEPCTAAPDCTGTYADGLCTVCNQPAPTDDTPTDDDGGADAPTPPHTHAYDGTPTYAQKDETVHTVTRACTTCAEQPTETVEEVHTYVDGACACGKAEPPADDAGDDSPVPPADDAGDDSPVLPADDVGDGSPVPPTPVDEAVESVKTQLEALPTVEALSAMTYEEKIALHDTAYLTAGNAYNALTEEQKAQVDASKLMALGEYFADPNNLMTTDEPVTTVPLNLTINKTAYGPEDTYVECTLTFDSIAQGDSLVLYVDDVVNLTTTNFGGNFTSPKIWEINLNKLNSGDHTAYIKLVPADKTKEPLQSNTVTFTYSPAARYKVIVENIEHGRVEVLPRYDAYAAGTEITLNPVPDEGYEFVSFGYTFTGSIAITGYRFTMPACNVTITARFKPKTIPVTGLTLTPENLSLNVGGNATLTATVTPDNATNQAVTWSTNNENVATVDENGLVTAVGPGTATITATAKDGSGVNATCTVTVSYLDTPELSFTIEDADYVDGDVHWFRGDNAATVNAPSGYTISATQGGPYAESVSIITPTVYLMDENGARTDAINLSNILKWDSTAPTGTIKLGDTNNTWNGMTNTPTTVYTQKKNITVEATDTESGIASIKYSVKSELVSDWTTITDWKTYDKTIELEENAQNVVYVKLTDHVGNVSCLSTDILCVDTVAPQFRNVENGDVFYTTQTFTAYDANGINKMYLNGTEFNGTISGNPDKDTEYTITATDQAGNATSIKITMKPIASLAEGLPTKDKVMPDDKQAIKTVLDQVESLMPEQSQDNPNEETEALRKIQETCTELLKLIDDAETVIELIEALPDASKVEPDDENAIKAYEAALDAYEDEDLPAESKRIVDEICKDKLSAVFKALTDYEIIKGHKSTYVKGSYKKLTLTANGYHGKFTGIEVDGEPLHPTHYSVEKGSTVITLKSAYLESLKSGKHYVRVNYTDGTTDGDDYFRVALNNGSPITGDGSHIHGFALFGLAAMLMMCFILAFKTRKKGRYER